MTGLANSLFTKQDVFGLLEFSEARDGGSVVECLPSTHNTGLEPQLWEKKQKGEKT